MKIVKFATIIVLSLYWSVVYSQYEVGEFGGVFNVNETGAATYTLPFDMPEGINGMKPSLGLIYNSQSGNGVVGMGTTISGLSLIYRIPKDIFHDGTAKGISYSTSDAYAKDGVRLLLKSGTEGSNGAIYNAEGLPYDDIILKRSGTSQYFIANLPDGSKAYYGTKTTFPVTTDTSSLWYLDKIVDIYGNTITYSYSIIGNVVYLSKVVYGTNENTETNFSTSVVFNYENRSDIVKSIHRAYKCNMSRRLKSVVVKTTQNTSTTIWYTYSLTYQNTDGFSRLKTITKTSGATQLPPVTFTWNNLLNGLSLASPVPNITQNMNMSDSDENYQYFLSCDITGDGKSNLVSITQTDNGITIDVFDYKKSSDIVSFEKIGRYNISRPDLYRTLRGSTQTHVRNTQTGSFAGNYFGDYNGDGINELIIPYFESTQQFGCMFYPRLKGNEQNVSVSLSSKNPPLHTIGDFYNCGKSQILFVDKYQKTANTYTLGMLFQKDNGVNSNFQIDITLSSPPLSVFAMDCNTNGLEDLLVVCKNGYVIFWNQGVSEGTCPFSSNKTSSYSNLSYSRILQQGDFNGDGLIDFISNSDNDPDVNKNDISGWYFFLNNGDGTFTKTLACTLNDCFSQSYTERDNNKYNCLVWDFNNDGKQDVVITKADYKLKKQRILFKLTVWGEFRNTCTYWLKSTGTSLVTERKTTSSNANDALCGHYTVGDFDGDGYIELVNYGYNCYTGNSTQCWHVYDNTSLSVASNKINKISTPNYGIETNITYTTLADNTTYTQGTDSKFPLVDMTLPIHIVKKTMQNVGGWSYNKDYSYTGLRVHVRGRGLLGFKSISVYDENTDELLTTTITSLDSIFYIPKEIVTNSLRLGIESCSKTTLTIKQRNTKNYYSSPSLVESTDMYGNKTTTRYNYNTNQGYLTLQRIDYGTNGNMYKQTEYNSFKKVGGIYKPQIVVYTQKHADDASPFIKKTLYVYDTNGSVVKKTEYSNTVPNYHSYTYDSFGNVTSHSLWASEIDTITTTYTYDATHRFIFEGKTNTSAIATKYTYNALDLPLKVEKTLDGTTIENVQYSYDILGRVTQVNTSPESTTTTYTYGWGNSEKKRYYIRTERTARPYVTTWYDNAGRVVLTETLGEDSINIIQEQSFNRNGSISTQTSTIGDISTNILYVYDGFDRLVMLNTNTGTNKMYSYENFKITENFLGHKTVKTYDEWGNVKTITDNESASIQYTYNSNGNVRKIDADDAIFQITYNAKGQQTSLNDPDAGQTFYTYDALGRIIKQVDPKGTETTNTYNKAGLLTKTVCDGRITSYSYDNRQRLTQETTGEQSITYQYNSKNQLFKKTIIIGTKSFAFRYYYNTSNQMYLMYYPDNTIERYYYDVFGNMNRVTFNGQNVWELLSNTGIIRQTRSLDSLSLFEFRYTDGYLSSTNVRKDGTTLHGLFYSFDKKRNLLLHRTNMLASGGAEDFTYDSRDRLVETFTTYNAQSQYIQYASNGNIMEKTGIGLYSYDSDRPHAVNWVDNIGGLVSEVPQYVTYTPFNKVATVNQGAYNLAITYGPDRQRCKTALSRNDTLLYTRYYADNYEEVHAGDSVYRYYYVYTPDGLSAVAEKKNSTMNIYSSETDYLGSIVALYTQKGQTVFRAEYDAWGRQNVVTDNLAHFQRGYCGHEHWHEFDLIDMNGRMYDPVISRFLSPDPFVQAPEDLQNYNRYSYCLNNPLKYTDPSGESIIFAAIIGGAIGGTLNWIGNGHEFSWKGLGYFGVGAVAGALGVCMGSGISSAIAGGSFGAGFVGTSAAKTATTCFVSGALIGVGSGFATGFTTGLGNRLIDGEIFRNAFCGGIKEGLVAGASGALVGGIWGGVDATRNGRNFWDGTIIKTKMDLPQFYQQGGFDCRYEVFRSYDTYYNKSTTNTNILREKYPNVEISNTELAKMYGGKKMNVRDIKNKNIENLVDIMKQGKGISIETKVNELYGHAVGVKSIKVYPNKFVIRVMNPEYGGYQKITSFDNVINMWQITKY